MSKNWHFCSNKGFLFMTLLCECYVMNEAGYIYSLWSTQYHFQFGYLFIIWGVLLSKKCTLIFDPVRYLYIYAYMHYSFYSLLFNLTAACILTYKYNMFINKENDKNRRTHVENQWHLHTLCVVSVNIRYSERGNPSHGSCNMAGSHVHGHVILSQRPWLPCYCWFCVDFVNKQP